MEPTVVKPMVAEPTVEETTASETMVSEPTELEPAESDLEELAARKLKALQSKVVEPIALKREQTAHNLPLSRSPSLPITPNFMNLLSRAAAELENVPNYDTTPPAKSRAPFISQQISKVVHRAVAWEPPSVMA